MSKAYIYIPNLSGQSQAISEDNILSRTIYGDDQLKAILFTFAAGQELSEHTSQSKIITQRAT